jgi:hypothetical protein
VQTNAAAQGTNVIVTLPLPGPGAILMEEVTAPDAMKEAPPPPPPLLCPPPPPEYPPPPPPEK